MKRLVLLVVMVGSVVSAYPVVGYDFTIEGSEHGMMKCFQIDSPQLGPLTIWKRALDAPTHYDFYDRDGEWNGEATASFFCLSLLYEWGIEIEIFNKEDLRIGYIEGHSDGKEAARIDLYNAREQLVGIALLNDRCDEITVRSPGGGVMATLTRQENSWEGDVLDRRQMHPRLLQVLAAWALDRQDHFLRYE